MVKRELLNLSWAQFARPLGFANGNRFRIQIFKTKKKKRTIRVYFNILLVFLLFDSAVAPLFP
jgi:hypothetical protein